MLHFFYLRRKCFCCTKILNSIHFLRLISDNDALTSPGSCSCGHALSLVFSGKEMEEYLLRFAIFLTYFFIAVSDKSLANGLKGFGKKHSATLHHLEGDRAENNRAKELFQRFVVNNQAVSSSPSWNQLSHELLGPASRSANPRMSLQVPKVSCHQVEIGIANLSVIIIFLKRFLYVYIKNV